MKKLSVLLLIALLSGMVSCGDTGTPEELTTSDTTDAVTTETPLLPDKKFEGASFRFATYESNLPFFYADEENGDLINDAVYKAVNSVMDRYDFRFEPIIYGTGNMDVENYVNTTVLSGDDEYEVVSGHDGVMFQLSLNDYFADMRDSDYHHFDEAWWMTYANEELMVNGRQHVFSSYMSYKSLSAARCLYMNTKLAEENKIAIPYASVYDGTWTLDEFYSLVRDFYRDANGNGERDGEDIYGWTGNTKLYCFQQTYLHCYKEGADGKVTLDFDREKLIDTAKKVGDILLSSQGGYITGNEPDSKMFLNGQSLFFYHTLQCMTTEEFREGRIDYTVLPLPKYDENQKDYVTATVDPHCGIPITCKNTDLAHFVVEALSIEGYENVRPVYFDQALSVKFAQNDDMPKMLQIIGDGLTLDMAYLNSIAPVGGLGRFVMGVLDSGSTDSLASTIETLIPVDQAKVDAINAYYGK